MTLLTPHVGQVLDDIFRDIAGVTAQMHSKMLTTDHRFWQPGTDRPYRYFRFGGEQGWWAYCALAGRVFATEWHKVSMDYYHEKLQLYVDQVMHHTMQMREPCNQGVLMQLAREAMHTVKKIHEEEYDDDSIEIRRQGILSDMFQGVLNDELAHTNLNDLADTGRVLEERLNEALNARKQEIARNDEEEDEDPLDVPACGTPGQDDGAL